MASHFALASGKCTVDLFWVQVPHVNAISCYGSSRWEKEYWGMTRMWDVRLATIQDLTLAFADSPTCLGF